ncbi:DNA-binding protein [Dechloromonas sp. HYN0024]|uniref:DNA-binding protein n=1 Tax=Dechloromonas sp. HYN0024 TaxID=2231055 RepID=UPI000E44E79C|nr:DNA-binding protein [Dechloromonas sp. HYN0024]AXS80155.1 hypothetical protein HYN24_09055 [Dechloromonas sp. HYN0024]
MPRAVTINYDDVVRHSEAIIAEGGKLTLRLIRERHGSGSLGTIQKHFQRWEKTQALARQAALSLPSSIQQTILEFVCNELSAGRSELEHRLCQAATYADELATENERLVMKLEEQLNTIDALRSEKSVLEGRLGEVEIVVGTLREESARERQAAEIARTDVARLMLRLERLPLLEAELIDARNACWLVDSSHAEVAKELAVAKSAYQALELSKNVQFENLQSRLADTQEKLQMATAQVQEAQTERFKAVAELAAVHAMRADEGSRVAERVGALEGSLTILRQSVSIPDQNNSF